MECKYAIEDFDKESENPVEVKVTYTSDENHENVRIIMYRGDMDEFMNHVGSHLSGFIHKVKLGMFLKPNTEVNDVTTKESKDKNEKVAGEETTVKQNTNEVDKKISKPKVVKKQTPQRGKNTKKGK